MVYFYFLGNVIHTERTKTIAFKAEYPGSRFETMIFWILTNRT